MSCSSLWGIKSDYVGDRLADYKNSWLFSPIIWGVLPDKYIPKEIAAPYGYKKSIIGIGGEDIWRKTNDKINHCEDTPDRICWELTNQQIFFTKDKKCVADNIRKFVEQNKKYDANDNGTYPLEKEHIIERFNEIAADIEELDESEYPYFVLKNSSCDDGVEYWFSKYNEETDEYEEKALKDWDSFIAEFVVIEDGKIATFISNTDYEY